MARTAIHVSEEMHAALCAYSAKTGLKKGAIADQAVAAFLAKRHFCVPKITNTQPQARAAGAGVGKGKGG